jgi:hypothetical protein
MSDQEWLTITEAAARAGISPARIRQLIHRRQVEFTRSKPRAHDTRIGAESLAEWQTHKTRGRPPGRQAPTPAPSPYYCVCCGQPLAKRRGRPPREGMRCLDCVIAGCSTGRACRWSAFDHYDYRRSDP